MRIERWRLVGSPGAVLPGSRLAVVLAGALGLLIPAAASAQPVPVFPAETAWAPIVCGTGIATDPVRDAPSAMGGRDIVGETASPAGFYADDGVFLFLRMRLDDTPRRGMDELEPFGWGFELDTDGDRTTYEFIILVDGIAGPEEVVLARNDEMRMIGDPSDVAETTLNVYPAATHSQVVMAPSMLGGNDDFFISVAVPIADMRAAGIPLDATVVWAGSSSNARSLNADLMCHDGNTGAPDLTEIPPGGVIIGPAVTIVAPADGATTPPTPTITGTSRPGATITITIDGGGTATVTADATGVWTYVPPAPLADGMHTVTATARDASGAMAMDSATFTVATMGDLDSDGDGLTDPMERPGGMDTDTDDDGMPNHLDPDDDGDGIPTRDERPMGTNRDTDTDAAPDHLDPDDDGDGIPTRDERPGGISRDSDADGASDHLDPDDDGDSIPTATETSDEALLGGDVDLDAIPARLDLDSDGDGLPDRIEGRTDTDGDGVLDYLDPDEAARTMDRDMDGFCAVGRDLNDDGDCDDPEEGTGPNDCDDTMAAVNPAATEICTNGIDDDCDGGIDTADDECAAPPDPDTIDMDGDGFCPVGSDDNADGDCDDEGEAGPPNDCDDDDDAVSPDATEDCRNGIDDDCDGDIDDDDSDCDATPPPPPPPPSDDGDGDGYCVDGRDANMDGDCGDPGEMGMGRDCNDSNRAVNPGADEVCDNDIDDDCDGDIDAADDDCATPDVPPGGVAGGAGCVAAAGGRDGPRPDGMLAFVVLALLWARTRRGRRGR
ncbi:MAG: hypothetical protein IT379_26145 [Deltaproteobacteria bacterium]|nr:hypothetical protein [Deltaproteobacteria bacterium]